MLVRTYRDDDFEAIVRAFDATWGWELDTDAEEKQALAAHYVAGAVAASNYTRVVEKDGRVIGIMCSSIQNMNDARYRVDPVTYLLVVEETKMRLSRTETGREILTFYDRIADINRELEEELRRNALDWQAEMTLLLCAPDKTCAGVGKALVGDLFDFMGQIGVQWCILKTDTHCAWEYYLKTGWTQAVSKPWQGQSDMRAFAFRKAVTQSN